MLIDWSQNDPGQVHGCALLAQGAHDPDGVRARHVGGGGSRGGVGRSGRLHFTPSDVLTRLDRDGDLLAVVSGTAQVVP